MRSFASDNNSGAHPAIMEAVAGANTGWARGYGEDDLSRGTDELFRRHFGSKAQMFFVTTGTAANVLGLKSMARSYHSVICSEVAHLDVDECGAPEAMGGYKLVPAPTRDAKVQVEGLPPLLDRVGDVHHCQPRVVSITQCTEQGTLYTLDEIRAIADFAHEHDLYLHMDGARICNAAAALGVDLKTVTQGVDVLSFGGTKNGCLMAEAVVFLNPEVIEGFKYMRKQSMQLVSKMRFISAQFDGLLGGDLWLENARHANAMAARLEELIRDVDGVDIRVPVQTNAIFAAIAPEVAAKLREKYYFYDWNQQRNEVRWMTSFNTTLEEVETFAADIKEAARQGLV